MYGVGICLRLLAKNDSVDRGLPHRHGARCPARTRTLRLSAARELQAQPIEPQLKLAMMLRRVLFHHSEVSTRDDRMLTLGRPAAAA